MSKIEKALEELDALMAEVNTLRKEEDDKEMMDMHSDADKDKLKAMIKDCKKEMKESKDQGKVIIENYFKSLIEG